MKCSEDVALHKKFVKKEQTYNLLASLNMEFDVVRVQILDKEDLPSLNKVISIVCAEEGRRGVMLETTLVEASTLVSLKTHGQNKGRGKEGYKQEYSMVCVPSIKNLGTPLRSDGSSMEGLPKVDH